MSAVSVLIDDSLQADGESWLFESPVELIRCDAPDQVPSALARIDAACGEGLYAAGFFAYELGYVLEPRLRPLLPGRRPQPLLWVGLFDRVRRGRRGMVDEWLSRRATGAGAVDVTGASMSPDAYFAALARIQAYIAAGDLYQVNLTFKRRLRVRGDPLALYRRLRRRQPVAHGGLIRAPDFHILSLSPELFVEVNDGDVTMRPMKGTAPRGADAAADAHQRRRLQRDAKNRAENVMIVDLMRNDLSRVARIGSVRVPGLFTVETYPTLHQMTSTVCGRLREDVAPGELLAGLFPCGSITGAPKVRAMEVIRELEPEARGIYTGSLGFIGPGNRMRFNVAIRTLHVDADGAAEMGIGSGIVADSDARSEYDECLLKARFIEADAEPPVTPAKVDVELPDLLL